MRNRLLRVRAFLSRYGRALFDLLYPRVCPITDEPLLPGELEVSRAALRKLPSTDFAPTLEQHPLAGNFAHATEIQAIAIGFWYEQGSVLQRLVHRMKYQDRPRVAEPLGWLLAQRFESEALIREAAAVTCVPMHPKKRRKRGYNQAELLAKVVADAYALPFYPNLLTKTRNTEAQARLDKQARLTNVMRAFEAEDKLAASIDGPILLVDDLVTTGATTMAASAALAAVGLTDVRVLALACPEIRQHPAQREAALDEHNQDQHA